MGERTKNLLIGVFVIIACAFLIAIILFLKPSVGNGKEILHVRLSNINQITVGTRVTYGGRAVGEVIDMKEIPDFRNQPTDALGRVYMYQLTLKVDSSTIVFDTDEVTLQTSGLLGEKSVAIIPKKPAKGVTPKLVTKQPIYANSIDPIDNTFSQIAQLADRMDLTFEEVTGWFKKYGDDVGCTVKEAGAAMNAATITMNNINDKHIIDDAKDGIHNFSVMITQMQDAIGQLQQSGVFTNIGTVVDNLKTTTHSIDIVTQNLADGKGSIGKLLKNDDMYLRVTAIMSKIDTLMNDVNHYGILFNLNKQWQRLRTRRVDEMNALSTPQGFKTYFEDEVDLINTSMSRLSMLVDKAQESPEREQIINSNLFKKDFAELLRQVDELADNLRLYNEQLMEAQGDP
jgi:phospholipid/cholesterol/gamma-HCH transport system substrate-binding protein